MSYIDYSNDLNQATPKGNLSSEQWKMAATGDANFGYFSGGSLTDTRARVDRIDYSNDTVTASPKGRLNVSRYAHSSSSARANGFAAVNGPAFSEVFAIESRPNLLHLVTLRVVTSILELVRTLIQVLWIELLLIMILLQHLLTPIACRR